MECDGIGICSFAAPTGFFNEFLLGRLNWNGLRGHERAWLKAEVHLQQPVCSDDHFG